MHSLDLLHSKVSPLQLITVPKLEQNGIQCWIKREDQLLLSAIDNDCAFSGNKWRKLKYNLLTAKEQGFEQLLSFGGAFSNHIAAVASAGKLFGFTTIGIIRGEATAAYNPTLQFAQDCGMVLEFVDRQTYRQKNSPIFIERLEAKYPNAYIIPEGGTNALALKGSAEVFPEIVRQLGSCPDYILLCCGTGGTAAGIIQSLKAPTQLIAYSVLKGDFHHKEIRRLIGPNVNTNWYVETAYHHGGYAKFTSELLKFIHDFYDQYQIFLDPVYTAKLFYAFWQQMQNGHFPNGSKVVLLHSGGLQGINGFNKRFGTQLPNPCSV